MPWDEFHGGSWQHKLKAKVPVSICTQLKKKSDKVMSCVFPFYDCTVCYADKMYKNADWLFHLILLPFCYRQCVHIFIINNALTCMWDNAKYLWDQIDHM